MKYSAWSRAQSTYNAHNTHTYNYKSSSTTAWQFAIACTPFDNVVIRSFPAAYLSATRSAQREAADLAVSTGLAVSIIVLVLQLVPEVALFVAIAPLQSYSTSGL